MKIIQHELKSNFKYTLIWSGIMAAIIAMMMAEFSAYYNNPQMMEIIKAMPESLLKAFSMDSINLTTLGGFLSVASVYFYILAAAFALILGNNIIAKEERDKTAEFFLTLPISRERVVFSKLIAAIIACIFFTGITTLTVVFTGLNYAPDASYYKFIGLTSTSMLLIQMIFLSMGLFMAAAIRRHKRSNIMAVILLMGLYMLSIVMQLTDKLNFLKYFTPFDYFRSAEILKTLTLPRCGVGLSISFTLLFLALTFYIYPKRDLNL